MNFKQEQFYKLMDVVFGEYTSGATLEERAKNSPVRWVRSVDHLAELQENSSRQSHDLVYTSSEALEIFGFDLLYETCDKGSGIIPPSVEEPGRTLKEARLKMGMSTEEVCLKTGLSQENVEKSESSKYRLSVKDFILLCRFYGLDPKRVGVKPRTA